LFKKTICCRIQDSDFLFWQLYDAVSEERPWKRLYNKMAKAVRDNP